MRHGRIGFWYRLAVMLVKPLSRSFTRRDWRGQDRLPRTGGVIVAANHVAHLDPLTLAHFVYDAGRLPRYLAKAELFEVPLVGRLLRGTGQIAVRRGSRDATLALHDALEALGRGECLVIYPEGTITKDPQGWPMTGHTGVARLALVSGLPVVPVGQWGPQLILPAYTKRPHLLPRKWVHVFAGPPVDLSEWNGRTLSNQVLREATDQVTACIRDLVAEIRGEAPPARTFDPRDHRRSA